MAPDLNNISTQPIAGGVVALTNPQGAGRVVLVCEHASNHIPARYDGLGISAKAKLSHIAWDPGALAVATHLSRLLDAPLISQRVSRLVYDCNRPPESPTSIPVASELYSIPGNQALSEEARQQRVNEVYLPFKAALSELLDQRAKAEPAPVLVTIHSFTPVFNHQPRPVEIGVLHDLDARLADVILNEAQYRPNVQRNQPYGPKDGVTHTLVEHALPRDLLNVMLEIRNDLIGSASDQLKIAQWLAKVLQAALHSIARNE